MSTTYPCSPSVAASRLASCDSSSTIRTFIFDRRHSVAGVVAASDEMSSALERVEITSARVVGNIDVVCGRSSPRQRIRPSPPTRQSASSRAPSRPGRVGPPSGTGLAGRLCCASVPSGAGGGWSRCRWRTCDATGRARKPTASTPRRCAGLSATRRAARCRWSGTVEATARQRRAELRPGSRARASSQSPPLHQPRARWAATRRLRGRRPAAR